MGRRGKKLGNGERVQKPYGEPDVDVFWIHGYNENRKRISMEKKVRNEPDFTGAVS